MCPANKQFARGFEVGSGTTTSTPTFVDSLCHFFKSSSKSSPEEIIEFVLSVIHLHPENRGRMKFKLDPETRPEQKMDRFQTALGSILTVSTGELNKRITEDEGGGGPT